MYLLMLGLLGIAGTFFYLDADEDDAPVEGDDTDLADQTIEISDGETHSGTAGDDRFILPLEDPGIVAYGDVTIEAGGGDDLIDLFDTDQDVSLNSATIYAGPGKDSISVRAFEAEIHGGAEDDHIVAEQSDSSGVFLYGDEGDDTIDARLSETGVADGGQGNDLLMGAGAGFTGTGYAIRFEGGAGNDTIQYDAIADYDGSYHEQPLRGGSGADLFQLNIDESYEGFNAPDGDLTQFASYDAATNTVSAQTVNFPDFEPGVDRLEIDGTPEDPAYVLAAVTLKEEGDETLVTLSYEADQEVTREVVIRLGATGVELEDIQLLGDVPLHSVA